MNPYSGLEDLAYLAGYIDADGSFFIRRINNNQSIYYASIVSITTTDEGMTLFIPHLMSKHNIRTKVLGPYKYKTQPNAKATYRIVVQRKEDILLLCGLIQPYVVLKAKQLRLLIQNVMTDNQDERRIYRLQVMVLNKKGDI